MPGSHVPNGRKHAMAVLERGKQMNYLVTTIRLCFILYLMSVDQHISWSFSALCQYYNRIVIEVYKKRPESKIICQLELGHLLMYQRCVAVTQPPLFVLRSAFWHSPPVNMRLQYACICYTFADGQSWRQGGPAVAQGTASLGIGSQQPREEAATLRPGGNVLIGFLLATSPPYLYEGLCGFNLVFFL